MTDHKPKPDALHQSPHNNTSDTVILRHLQKSWKHYNQSLFSSKMKCPQMALQDFQHAYAMWNPSKKLIAFNRDWVYQTKWLNILEVLKHEMAHQYSSQILHITQESAHGETFQHICEERGIDARASGEIELSDRQKSIMRKVHKLLALAQSNQSHEAHLAAQQAQYLLLKHHLTFIPEQESPPPVYSKQLGQAKKRYYRYEYEICHVLTEYFFVDCIWVQAFNVQTLKIGQVAEICGRTEDLEIAQYVHDFLHNHLSSMWRIHKKENQLKGLSERLSFSLGVVNGFAQQLKHKRHHVEQQLKTSSHAVSNQISMQCLLVRSQEELQSYLHKRYPRIHESKVSQWTPTTSYYSGYQKGKKLNLHKAVTDKSTKPTQKKIKQLDNF
jgi:hypothetical protein